MAGQLANHFLATGVEKGDRVIIFMDNSIEVVAALFGILKTGAAFVIPNATMKARKLNYIINDSGAKTIVAHINKVKVIKESIQNTKRLNNILWCGENNDKENNYPVFKNDKIVSYSWDEILNKNPEPDPGILPEIIDVDLATIIYTSGSTADPKGVICSHLNAVSVSNSIIKYLKNTEDDVILCALPLSFDYGLYQILMTFSCGGTVVLEKSFSYPLKIIENISRYSVTGFPIVPTMLSLMLEMKNLESIKFETVRYFTSTGSPLTPTLIRQIRKLWPHAVIYSMYGLTECKRVSYLPPELIDQYPESVGIAIPNTEVFVVNEDGQKVFNNQTGELVVRGVNVMLGYWNDPDLSKRTFRRKTISGDVWLYTGDLFKMDGNGLLYFVGRKNDIIKSKGERVSPKEIEAVLCEIDGVLEAAVIGIPDPIIGEAIKAFIVKRKRSITEKIIKEYCMRILEPFMIPKYIEFIDDLPKISNGKIDKKRLK